MSVLYVTQPGAEIRKNGDRLIVQYQEEVLTAIPLRDVERVILLGPIQVSASTAQILLKRCIPVIFATTRGQYCGKLSTGQGNTELLLKQVDLYRNEEYRLKVSKGVVSVKMRHQRSLLRRHERNHPDPDIQKAADDIDSLLESMDKAGEIPSVMGYEGQASALYFGVFGKCLRQEGIEFINRNRRPPMDPVNALLSFGYMLVTGEAVGALASFELHLGLGFLHEIAPNRPSLALDLVEIFRQPVVDRLTLSLINRRVFTPVDFLKSDTGGVKLTEDGLKRYLFLYEKAMTTPFQIDGNGTSRTFRQLIADQSQELRNAIRDGKPWSPILLDL